MLKVPYEISDYKTISLGNYYYIDKTMYLKLLEEEGDILGCFGPKGFGKSLFISMMYYYYDVNSNKYFNDIFKENYVFSNFTDKKNSYYILKFDFSKILLSSKVEIDVEREFFNSVNDSIRDFISYYGLEWDLNCESITLADLLLDFFSFCETLNLEHKIYVLVDSYDEFINRLLFVGKTRFREFADNIVREFYRVIKKYYDCGVVSKIFICGISPIVLSEIDFNDYINITNNSKFSTMLGVSYDEVLKLLSKVKIDDRDKLFRIMFDNYSGYRFLRDNNIYVFNISMVAFFMMEYNKVYRVPNVNLDSDFCDYNQFNQILRLLGSNNYNEMVEILLKYGKVMGRIKNRINNGVDFVKDDILTLLYYYGYLTIKEVSFGDSVLFSIGNYSMKSFYSSYFFEMLSSIGVSLDNDSIDEIFKEIVLTGKIDKLSSYVELILKYIDNKIFMKRDNELIKLLYYIILNGRSEFYIYSNYKYKENNIDLILFKNIEMCKNNIIIEVRYLENNTLINEKMFETIKKEVYEKLTFCQENDNFDNEHLKKYIVIFKGKRLARIEELI